MQAHLFINGEWVEGEEYSNLVSPFSGDIIARVPIASRSQVDDAVQAARRATATMRDIPAHARAGILERVAGLLDAQAEEAARLIATEAAKPISAARAEVGRTVQTYKFAAEEAKRIHGETIPLDAAPGGENRIAYTVREPLGVIAAITPFNFPMNLVAHKVGPALAAGNTIVLKPAEQTPLSAFFIARLFEKAGLPSGALNVVSGPGGTVGNQLVSDETVKMITFTGSPSVGKSIRQQAGLKRVTLELGSNSAVIIDKNTPIASIIPRCVSGAFSYQGQVCISLQRIYVHKEVYEDFVNAFVEQTKRLQIGDPLLEQTDVSALIRGRDVARSLEWIDEAIQAGGQIAIGGEAENGILKPTVILNCPPAVRLSCQEVFAPVAIINRVSSIEQAIELVNDSRYGLQAGVYTEDLRTAIDAAERLHVGGVMINDIPTFRVDLMPYGGVKESGIGREGVRYAIEEMTELKLVVINRN